MPLSVCPAAIVAAPVETVWALLSNLAKLDEWADATVERIVPEGPATSGQQAYLKSSAFGRAWHVVFTVESVDPAKHTLQTNVVFPLGMVLQERIMCTPIDATSCRVQYG